MPRTPEENERIRQITQEKIRAAAMEMFMKKGYHATSISDIAKCAGISKGLLYNYFKGKEELLAAMVRVRINEIADVMEEAKTIESPKGQIRHIIEGAVDNVHLNPDVFRFYLHLQTQPVEDEELIKYSRMLIEENAQQFEYQCEIFEQLNVESPRQRSLYFSASLQGTLLMISTYPDHFPIKEIKHQLTTEFCGDH